MGWAPRFTAVSTVADDDGVTIESTDEHAALRLITTVNRHAGGAIILTAELVNEGDDDYWVDDLAITLARAAARRRAADVPRAVVPRVPSAPSAVRRRSVPVGEPARPHLAREPAVAVGRHRRLRRAARRGVGRSPGVERQRALPRRSPARRAGGGPTRRAAASRRGGAPARRALSDPTGVRGPLDDWPRCGEPAVPRRRAVVARPSRPTATRRAQHVGGGVLRSRLRHARPTRRARRRGRRRALRARRRLVRRAP